MEVVGVAGRVAGISVSEGINWNESFKYLQFVTVAILTASSFLVFNLRNLLRIVIISNSTWQPCPCCRCIGSPSSSSSSLTTQHRPRFHSSSSSCTTLAAFVDYGDGGAAIRLRVCLYLDLFFFLSAERGTRPGRQK